MGQIVKRKKKGRPPKSDLARRQIDASEPARRRSLRRRNVRYDSFIDYDDYLDEYEEFEEEVEDDEEEDDERRKEKKLKLVVKLNSQKQSRSKLARGDHAREGSAAASSSDEEEEGDEEEEEGERKPLKKRKISGGDGSEGEEDEIEHDREERERKADHKVQDLLPGTPPDHPSGGLPLPEKKTLELILDKLQKKDTYSVYAEPVDLEELPDYLDVIDHPMDFATLRKKLGNGAYSTLEQFESDVFLICSNAMQYNTPETIYYKQARAIQELAKKKFEKLRIAFERSEKEHKSEQKTKSNFLAKKQMKKPFSRTMQEPVGSDFSAGATLASAGEVQNGSVATQAGGCEKPGSIDSLAEGNFSLVDNNQEKTEELPSGKGLLSKFGRKMSVLDENRRATYNMSNQPVIRSESIFTTFESEIKQLVPVGLDAQNFYGRSLARFAATLGPVAWKVASDRIEKSLTPGCKFGRGWVGEYEPLPTSVLMLEKRFEKEPNLLTKSQCTADLPKNDGTSRASIPTKEQPIKGSVSETKQSLFRPTSRPMLERKSSPSSSAVTKPIASVNPTYQQQNLPPRNFTEMQVKSSKLVELNFPPSSDQHDADIVAEKQLPNKSGMSVSKAREVSRTVGNKQAAPFKQLECNGAGSRGLSNGKVVNSSVNSRVISSSSDSVPTPMARATSYFPQGQDQGLSDPIEAMRISAEKAHKQQKPSNQASADTPPVTPSVPSVTKESSNASAAAARAWMSIGAGGFRPPAENSSAHKNQISAESLYNPTRQLHPQFPRVQGQFHLPVAMQHFQAGRSNLAFQAFMRPVHTGNEGQFQNRPMVFPQLVATDLTRFQMQSPWQGLSPHSQSKQKQESLPPDLNFGFQSPGSPVKQSSGVVVDSQQPDLALQL